jgi:hypothetical protein
MLPQSLSFKKPLALGSVSTLVLGLSLISIPALAQGIFSLFVFAFGKNMDLLFYVNVMSNMTVINAIPPVIGGVLLAYVASRFIRAHYRVDWGRMKKQSLHASSWLFIAAVTVSCFVAFGLPTSKAMNTATTGYILDTPVSDFDFLIGNYSNGNIYAINGSNWDNLVGGIGSTAWAAYTGNYTKIEELALQTLSTGGGGKVFCKNVAFDLALMGSIPVNVIVVCSYGSQEYAYINPSSSVGAPYTVSIGEGLNGGYYIAEDGKDCICYASLYGEIIINNAMNALTTGRTWQETVKAVGNFTVDTSYYSNYHPVGDATPWKAALKVPGYTFLDLTEASITLKNNASTVAGWPSQKNMIIASTHDGTDKFITILGGEINGNHINQNVGDNDGEICVNSVYGIQMQGVKNCTIDGVFIHDTGETSIAFENPSSDVGSGIIVRNCKCLNSGQDGIGNTANQYDTIYENNYVENAGINRPSHWTVNGNGIMADGQRIQIRGNTVIGSYLNGIQIPDANNTAGTRYHGTHSADILITDNTVLKNGGDGINVNWQDSVTPQFIIVTENTVSSNVEHGIFFYGSNSMITHNTVTNNAFSGGHFSGVVIAGGSNVTFADNIVGDDQASKTQEYGLAVQNPTFLNAHDNILTGNELGAFLRYGSASNISLSRNSGMTTGFRGWYAVGNTAVIADWSDNSTLTSGVTYFNDGSAKTWYVLGGSVTNILVDGRTIGLTNGTIILKYGSTLRIDFSVQPTIEQRIEFD